MNTGRKFTSCAVMSVLLVGALPRALADSDADEHFKRMDADGDGRISRAEHAAGAQKMFAQCDANRDGIVTAAEMEAATALKGGKPAKDEKSAAEKIRVIDKDGDGKLTAAEHAQGTETMFEKMDTNKDGFLSKAECDAGMKLMKKGA